MGKKIKITESQLKMLVKSKKMISEQPENNPVTEDHFELIYRIKGHDNVVLLRKRERMDNMPPQKKYGIYSNETGRFIYEPDYVETNVDLMGERDDMKVVTEFTNPNGDKFYILYTVNGEFGDNVNLLSEKEFMELGHQLQPIDLDDETVDLPKKEENQMNESIDKIKSQFKRFM